MMVGKGIAGCFPIRPVLAKETVVIEMTAVTH